MALDITSILDRVVSHALSSGYFEAVNGHEPKSPPSSGGLTAAVWVQKIGPAVGGSSLISTSSRLAFCLRLYTPSESEPQDAIDPNLIRAVDWLFGAYSGDFTLGGIVRDVDLLGAYGDPLGAEAGYVLLSGTEYRVMDITLPIIVNDLWTQEA